MVATQNVPAPTSYSFALNGQSNISSTVNNLPVNVSQLPTNATLTSVCVQISYNATVAFATHNDLDISLMGPNGMTIVLEDFFAGSTNVPTQVHLMCVLWIMELDIQVLVLQDVMHHVLVEI